MEIKYLCLVHNKDPISVSHNFLLVRDPYKADNLPISLA